MSYAEDEGFDGWWPDEYPENYAYAVLSKRRFISSVALKPLPSGRGYDATPFGEKKKSIAFWAIS